MLLLWHGKEYEFFNDTSILPCDSTRLHNGYVTCIYKYKIDTFFFTLHEHSFTIRKSCVKFYTTNAWRCAQVFSRIHLLLYSPKAILQRNLTNNGTIMRWRLFVVLFSFICRTFLTKVNWLTFY